MRRSNFGRFRRILADPQPRPGGISPSRRRGKAGTRLDVGSAAAFRFTQIVAGDLLAERSTRQPETLGREGGRTVGAGVVAKIIE